MSDKKYYVKRSPPLRLSVSAPACRDRGYARLTKVLHAKLHVAGEIVDQRDFRVGEEFVRFAGRAAQYYGFMAAFADRIVVVLIVFEIVEPLVVVEYDFGDRADVPASLAMCFSLSF